MRFETTACSLSLLLVASAWNTSRDGFAQSELHVSTDFEGGSARILGVDSKTGTIRFTPGGDADRGWVCWWSMRIENVEPGQRLTLELSPSDQATRNQGHLTKKPLHSGWCMPNCASISSDGRVWRHSAAGKRDGDRMHYEVTAEGTTLWVAWGPQFTPINTAELLSETLAKVPGANQFELARSREDRPVMGLMIRSGEQAKLRPGVWVQARQHAWESGSSWVARGLVEWLAEPNESASWLARNAETIIVPIMDVDNAATGNGGKEANPRDHNRDWDHAPVYSAVRAAQQRLEEWATEGRLDLFIDLHNPAPNDSRPFFFCGPPELLSDLGRDNRALFLGIAQSRINGPLPVEPAPRITGPSYHPLWRQISGQWVNDHGNSHTVAICLETAWNTPSSTTDGYRIVGQQLGETIVEYLKRRQFR